MVIKRRDHEEHEHRVVVDSKNGYRGRGLEVVVFAFLRIIPQFGVLWYMDGGEWVYLRGSACLELWREHRERESKSVYLRETRRRNSSQDSRPRI